MIGILDGRNFLNGCSDLLLALTPHLLIFFTTAGFEKRRAKRNARGSDLLPDDVLPNILARLPAKSLCRMRAVSKMHLNIIDDPSFATVYASRLLNSKTTIPELMLVTESGYYRKNHEYVRVTTLRPLKYNGKQRLVKSSPCNITRMVSRYARYQVRFVFCNLFLFERSGKLFLVNPLRGEALELPIIHGMSERDRFREKRFGMGFDDVTSTHKIVCIWENPSSSELVAYVYTLGSKTWRKINAVPRCRLSLKLTVSAYGDMHWLISGRHRIISFDLKNEKFVWTPHPKLKEEDDYVDLLDLLNYKGCLALVSTQHPYLKIWVLKDYEKKEWELEYKIHMKMFYRRGLYDPSFPTCSQWEHGIFFTSNDESKKICAFHFWDARYNSTKYIDPETLLPSVFSGDHQLWSGPQLWGVPQLSIFSYTHESLISLKKYGNLVERKVRSAVFEATQTSTISLDTKRAN